MTIPQPIVDLCQQAITSFFQENGATSLMYVGSTDQEITFIENGICSIIGFAGMKVKGTLIISLPTSLILGTHPLKDLGIDIEIADQRDWAGEIANQALGRIKTQFLQYALDFGITTPTVVTGKDISIQHPSKGEKTKVLMFDYDGNELNIKLFINLLDENIDFSTSSDKNAEKEGATLFF